MSKLGEKQFLCPICTSSCDMIWQNFSNSSIFINNEFLPIRGQKIGCVNCSHIFSTIDPEEHKMEQFYFSQDRKRHSSKNSDSLQNHGYYDDAINLLSSFLSTKNLKNSFSILEIGCGNGELLSSLKNSFSYLNVFGIDINESAKEVIDSDIKILVGMFPKTKFENKKFDLIIVNSVLEHQKDLHGFLNNIEQILNDDGEVFLEVPYSLSILLNRSDLGIRNIHDLFNHEHLHHFSTSSLYHLLNKNGWSIEDYQFVSKGIWDTIQVRIKKSNTHSSFPTVEKFTLFSGLNKFNESKNILTNKIQLIFNDPQNLGIYGVGWHTSVVLPQLFPKLKTFSFKIFDNDFRKHHSKIFDRTVIPSEELKLLQPSKLIISTMEGSNEIKNFLLNKFGISDSLIELY